MFIILLNGVLGEIMKDGDEDDNDDEENSDECGS